MAKSIKRKLLKDQEEKILTILMNRFDKHKNRHKTLEWAKIKMKLEKYPEKLRTLYEMENTGGEPDVISYDKEKDEYTFCDCSDESPKGRRSICYDNEALLSRKEFKPKTSAVAMASDIGIEILTEHDYRELQKLGNFDLKTSSWLKTPEEIRKLKGAIFGDKRYNQVFIYHNGAESYYAARGFRGKLTI